MKDSKSQGSVLIVVIIIVLAILGALGYIAWNNFLAPKNQPAGVNNSTDNKADAQPNTEYKTVTISGRTFRYPLNKNNEEVIVIPDTSTPGLKVSYGPIRNYYFNKDVSDDCKSYIAGLVSAYTQKEMTDYSVLLHVYNKTSLKDALADGTLVQVGSEDLYVGGPHQQNELCTDIYENKDPELQNIRSDVPNIRLAWLKSLELVKDSSPL